jgi:hemolysin activation/secretion protein
VATALLSAPPPGLADERREQEVRFDIKAFEINGNTIFGDEVLLQLIAEFVGPAKRSEDVETARVRIEKYYHQKGYPTVLVNIPEQSVGSGEVILEVIESTIRRVRVSGNRYYTMEKILTMTPSLQPGTVLYLPRLQTELTRLNRHPDLKVAPTLSPGKELGTIDVELKVIDKLPMHGSLELNNRNSHDTTDLRLNALVKYDNLWQRDHSASLQFQTSPEDTREVQAYAGSYVLAPFWNDEHVLALYGVYSDSDNAFGEGFQTTGKGFIVGLRNVMPLAGGSQFYHNVTLGLDYKDFDEWLGFDDAGQEDITTPVTYLPLSISYGAVQMDGHGSTEITLGLNLLPRGLISEREEFEDKRFKSRANYVYAGLTAQRTQHLGAGWDGVIQVDGQLADQPLISNEQYNAGGMNSVSGYKESEVSGDNAVRARIGLATPDLIEAWVDGSEDTASRWHLLDLRLHGYYDYARLWTLEPLPSEDGSQELQGVGAGLTGAVGQYFDWALQWGLALNDTDRTEANEQLVYFFAKAKF